MCKPVHMVDPCNWKTSVAYFLQHHEGVVGLKALLSLQLRRTTFHDLMLDVHFRLHQHERTQDPLSLVAEQLMSEFKVLCLDEFFVTDVADATMLNRLFSQMWNRGLVFIATSNR